MTNTEAARILRILLDGFDPNTGELLPDEHVCLDTTVMCALQRAIRQLMTVPTRNEVESFLPIKSNQSNAGRPWTATDDAQLRILVEQGAQMDFICTQLARRPRGTEQRMLYLGLIQKEQCHYIEFKHDSPDAAAESNAYQRWTQAEDNLLKQMFHENRPLQTIMSTLRRTRSGVTSRMVKLELIDCRYDYFDTPDQARPWSKQDTADLREDISGGRLSIKQLAEKYGRTVPAMQTRLFYMGILKELPFSLTGGTQALEDTSC